MPLTRGRETTVIVGACKWREIVCGKPIFVVELCLYVCLSVGLHEWDLLPCKCVGIQVVFLEPFRVEEPFDLSCSCGGLLPYR